MPIQILIEPEYAEFPIYLTVTFTFESEDARKEESGKINVCTLKESCWEKTGESEKKKIPLIKNLIIVFMVFGF